MGSGDGVKCKFPGGQAIKDWKRRERMGYKIEVYISTKVEDGGSVRNRG